MRLVLGKSGKGRPAEPTNGDRSDRVGRKSVTPGGRHAKGIAGQREAHDLPATVRQQLVKAHDAVDQIIERRRHVFLGKYRLARGKMDLMSKMREFPHLVLVERGAEAEVTDRTIGTGLPLGFDGYQRLSPDQVLQGLHGPTDHLLGNPAERVAERVSRGRRLDPVEFLAIL